MTATAFDTLGTVRDLEAAGVERRHEENMTAFEALIAGLERRTAGPA